MIAIAPVAPASFYNGDQYYGRMPDGKYKPCDGDVDYREIFEAELAKIQKEKDYGHKA